MTINMTFNDLDEMESAILRMAENIEAKKIFKTSVPDPAVIKAGVEKILAKAEETPAEPEPVKEAPNRPGSNVPEQPSIPPMPEPKKAEEAPQKAEPEAPKVDRVALRKILSVLNKTTGENTARKLINEMGFSALTNVPDDRLAELKAKAEEVINAS
jgi:hypothetical protein